jgi:hypothetical protein
MNGCFYSFILASTYLHHKLCLQSYCNLGKNNLDTSTFKVIGNLVSTQLYFGAVANILLILVTGTTIPFLK